MSVILAPDAGHASSRVWELHQRSRELVPQGTMGWTGEVIGALVLY